jgi:hypothetical protein
MRPISYLLNSQPSRSKSRGVERGSGGLFLDMAGAGSRGFACCSERLAGDPPSLLESYAGRAVQPYLARRGWVGVILMGTLVGRDVPGAPPRDLPEMESGPVIFSRQGGVRRLRLLNPNRGAVFKTISIDARLSFWAAGAPPPFCFFH